MRVCAGRSFCEMEYKVIRVVFHGRISPIEFVSLARTAPEPRVREKRLGRADHHTATSVLGVSSNIIDRAASRFTFIHSSVFVRDQRRRRLRRQGKAQSMSIHFFRLSCANGLESTTSKGEKALCKVYDQQLHLKRCSPTDDINLFPPMHFFLP